MDFLFLIILALNTLDQVGCYTSSYTTFNNSVGDDFITPNDNSVILKNAIQVTRDVSGSVFNLSGKVLYKRPFDLWSKSGRIASFNSTFVVNIETRNDIGLTGQHGGEGLAFILAKDAELPTNSEGQWLGIVNASTNGSFQSNIVAIELDTKKSFAEDLDDNHVGLDINSVYSKSQVSLSRLGIRISEGKDITVRINYDGVTKVMKVSVKAENQTEFSRIMSVPIDLALHLSRTVYVGFLGSTGTGSENNCVKSWFFNADDIDRTKRLWVWIVIPVIIVVLLLCSTVGWCLYVTQRRKENQARDDDDLDMQNIETGLGPKKFRLKELKGATGNFSPKNELGRGGFGIVYKGMLDIKDVAVKRIINTSQGKQNLIAEVTTIGSLHHKNLVELIGWCYEKNEFLLVYEYMPNGSLDQFIRSDDENMILGWEIRHNIICGVALSLDYLHHECSKRVLHRDIKSSNIMLDSEFNARLGDFGLARTFKLSEKTHHTSKDISGTPGYMAPEIFLTGRSTTETDVYAFGVVMLEVVCGRRLDILTKDDEIRVNIIDWVWEFHKHGVLTDAIDPKLKGQFDKIQAECMLALGLACCHPNPYIRPSMRITLQVFWGEVAPPDVPLEKPAFMWPANALCSYRENDLCFTGGIMST
ncbi:probable L-type lectin-domain containing receptor kinase S.5 [Chenopodium quinoa]|nr:probable L-type lectin-domain containing receptor kinase S.5 [Chenopodium quinoa]